MNQQAHPGPDYSGQNLSGRSFRGQDLRGAVFRNADLRGVGFCEADLTGADFSGARMGKTSRRWLWELPVQFMSGIIEGIIIIVGFFLMARLMIAPLSELISATELADTAAYYWALLPWLGLQMGFAWTAWRGRLEGFVVRVMVFVAVAVAAAVSVSVSVSVSVYVPVLVLVPVYVLVIVAVAVAVAEAWIVAAAWVGVMVGAAPLAGAVSVAIAVLASWWLSRQALHVEILELDWLRRWSLRFRCGGGTDFRDAVLTGADFSNTQLEYAHFAGANLNRTHWQNANNLHLANTYCTVLQAKPIRELMTAGKTKHKDFHGLDLHGLDFSGLNLAVADFTDCDLSGASFAGADLTAAKLTRAVLIGAVLTEARLTGATIGQWNIDKNTQFDGIVCEYVYLDEACKERHPATGEFRPGEFAKLYQEIAHTVDFLIENSTQMEALLRALEKLRASYADEDIAQVQKVERKGEAYKVSVAVPAEMEEILRKEIRQEFAQQLLESQSHLKLLQNDQQHLQRERDNLKEMLVLSLSRPININATAEANAMNDHSRKIENSPISNSAVNLGDNTTQSYTAQVGGQLAEIAPLLEQLRGLISQSTELPEVLKQDALEKVDLLRAAAEKPAAEAKITAGSALAALNTTAKLATGISSVVAGLSKLFGF